MVQVRSRLWLPFTQMHSFDAAARTFVRASGVMIEDATGHRVFDATSSIWTIVHGHAHPALVEAIASQAAGMDHVTALGATHPLAERLAWRVCELAGMDRAFFSGDGASAVEAAMKMALGYWQRRGEPQRTRFVRLRGSYHGDTSAAMSVSDIPAFRASFGALTFETLPLDDANVLHDPSVAAAIVEPLVQAANGMQPVAPSRYGALNVRETLLIVDEIATGFGRTGTMFAHEQLDVTPDIVCVGKGLSGGVLALSGTLVASKVYEAFYGEPGTQFFHGHSFAANPIACAAALASLDLFEREGTLERAQSIAARIEADLARIARHPAVDRTMQTGTMTGIAIHERIEARGAASPGWRVANGLYERGYFTRPIGNVVQLVPPLSTADAEIDGFFEALERELDQCI